MLTQIWNFGSKRGSTPEKEWPAQYFLLTLNNSGISEPQLPIKGIHKPLRNYLTRAKLTLSIQKFEGKHLLSQLVALGNTFQVLQRVGYITRSLLVWAYSLATLCLKLSQGHFYSWLKCTAYLLIQNFWFFYDLFHI